MPIKETLKVRAKTHGEFFMNAALSQDIKQAMRRGEKWEDLTPEQCEALECIAGKVARIICGNATYIDHWRDISGYATLVADTCSDDPIIKIDEIGRVK